MVMPRAGSEPLTSSGHESGPQCDRRPMRADAVRNREVILEAAETVFAAQGVSAPIDEVAREAGLGVGTVYRHFPTKEALFEAIVTARIEQLVCEVSALSQAPDPGEALFSLLRTVVETGSKKKDLADALASAGVDIKAKSSEHFQVLRGEAEKLLLRAQNEGQVRGDVTVDELMGLVAGACISHESYIDAAASSRMLEVICDGLRARPPA